MRMIIINKYCYHKYGLVVVETYILKENGYRLKNKILKAQQIIECEIIVEISLTSRSNL